MQHSGSYGNYSTRRFPDADWKGKQQVVRLHGEELGVLRRACPGRVNALGLVGLLDTVSLGSRVQGFLIFLVLGSRLAKAAGSTEQWDVKAGR